MDLDRLETLARELFVDNIKLYRRPDKNVYVSPLNADAVAQYISGRPAVSSPLSSPVDQRRKAARAAREQAPAPHPPAYSFDFPLTTAEYRSRIDTFNTSLGDHARVQTLGEGLSMRVVTEFPENPEQAADRLDRYGAARGTSISKHRGRLIPYIRPASSTSTEYIDLFLRRHVVGPDMETPFDAVRDAREHTFILPYLFPEFAISVMKAYVASRLADH